MVNDLIRAPELRVVDAEGNYLGVMSSAEAQALAEQRELDLVIIQPNAEPPVAKVIDFGRFKYEKEKASRIQKAKAKNVEVKGIRLSVRIAQHDIDVRKAKAKEFLDEGNKVKVEIILRGREKRFGELANQVITQFVAAINAEVPVKTEQPITRMGGQLTTIIGKA